MTLGMTMAKMVGFKALLPIFRALTAARNGRRRCIISVPEEHIAARAGMEANDGA
jgi:hypothetical protein